MSVTVRDDVLYESLEIRVLGPLRVRRADGTVVQPAEWSTSQTADLLRMLALRVDEPVPVEVLTDALWPRVDEVRGRASLRNAASRLRKVLGEDCVQRRLGGLVLTGAWVDVQAFRTLAQQVRREMLAGAWARVVTTTREAEALYLGDFRAHNDGSEWALREREALAATYRMVVGDAAEAAAALGWWHDAVGFAERTLALEPCAERAFRVLMRAQHGLGETALALKTFDRCRRVLADDVGADPSVETRALYLELLADAPAAVEVPPFRGRSYEGEWLRELVETSIATREPTIVCVTGPAGSGKTRLVEQALPGGSPLASLSVSGDPQQELWPAVRAAIEAADRPVRAVTGGAGVRAARPAGATSPPVPTVVIDDVHRLPPSGVDELGHRLAALRGAACVVLVGRSELDDGRAERLVAPSGARGSVLRLPPLESEEIESLCAALLHGEVSDTLVADVAARTGGHPGPVVRLVRAWAASGRIAATSSGLVALHRGVAGQTGASVRHLLTEAVDRLPPDALDLLHLVAVVGRPVTVEVLLPLTESVHLGMSPGDETATGGWPWLRATLDHLTDLTLLVPTPSGLAPRDALFTDLVLTWLRPSARRQLHRLVAERAHITSAERVVHWTHGGEPQLARAAAMDAAEDAVEEHQFERARLHLRRLCRSSEESNATPSDRMELYERWGEAAAQLGRTQEARAAFAAAASTARAHRLPDLARLELRSRGMVGPGDEIVPNEAAGPVEPAPAPVPAMVPRPAPGPTPAAAPAWSYPGAPTDLDHLALRRQGAIRDADAAGDADRRARARNAFVWDVCIPQRRFRSVRRVAKQALELASDPEVLADALAGGWFATAVVGDAADVEVALEREAPTPGGPGPAPTGGSLLALQVLVAHDLGRPELRSLRDAATRAGLLDDPSTYQWLEIRTCTERNDLAAALRADAVPTPATASPLVRALRGCASAALAMELGRAEDARQWLLEVMDEAQRTGGNLLVPEAAARLAMLEAHTDVASARRRFDQYEESVDTRTWFPRENVLKLLARAAMRSADGRPADAAAAAAGAAHVAERSGLVHLAAMAHRHRAFHLTAAGSPHEARLATAAEARWQQLGGIRPRRSVELDPPDDDVLDHDHAPSVREGLDAG